MLLEAQTDGVIALGNFVATYMKYFGHKCKIATFGFSKLTDLIEAVSGVAKVSLVEFADLKRNKTLETFSLPLQFSFWCNWIIFGIVWNPAIKFKLVFIISVFRHCLRYNHGILGWYIPNEAVTAFQILKH